MKIVSLNLKKIEDYKKFLYEEERSQSTIFKYMRDIRGLYEFLDEDKYISKESLVSYKQYLLDGGYKITSINSMLVAINGMLDYLGLNRFKLKLFKIQRKVFYEEVFLSMIK